MQAVILAGGRGTRLETPGRPKSLARIGEHSLLWHVVERFFAQRVDRVAVALGAYADCITSELPDEYPGCRALADGHGVSLTFPGHPHRLLRLVDTGRDTATAGRLLAMRPWLAPVPFLLSWTDVLSDLDYHALRATHPADAAITLTAARPTARFGRLEISAEGRLTAFAEKDRRSEPWVHAGISVVAPSFFALIHAADEAFETGPVARAVAAGCAHAHRHDGFWQCMDYPFEQRLLDDLWSRGEAPWAVSGRRGTGRFRPGTSA